MVRSCVALIAKKYAEARVGIKIQSEQEQNEQLFNLSKTNVQLADKNKDGRITSEELSAANMQISTTSGAVVVGTTEQLDSIEKEDTFMKTLKNIDADDNGIASLNELNKAGMLIDLSESEKELVDIDGDGSISAQELYTAGLQMTHGKYVLYDKAKWAVTQNKAKKLEFDVFDLNKDGQISFEEYKKMQENQNK